MTQLTDKNFREAMAAVNTQGFAAIDLSREILPHLGQELYAKMDGIHFHKNRATYYNEIAFYWPEDWSDVELGIGAFHEQKSLKNILPHSEAAELLQTHFGSDLASSIIAFVEKIKTLTVSNHFGLNNNELRLARVMMRQMNQSDHTSHGGANDHEDIGYANRPYQQLLSVIVTTFGIPTEAERHAAKVGELLLFNAVDRRKLLGLSEELAFIHKGPKSGPKMFFFFEFLGPRTKST